MVRILVTPERLNDLSQQMIQAAAQLRDIEGQLGRTLSGLDWEARQQANVDGQVSAARTQARQLSDKADALARYLAERSGAFHHADAQGVDTLGSLSERFRETIGASSWNKIQEINQQARKIIDLGEFLAPIGTLSLAGLFAIGLKSIPSRPNSVAITAPAILKIFPRQLQNTLQPYLGKTALRQAVGLDNLTVAAPKTIANKMMGATIGIGLVTDVSPQIYNDFTEYGLSKEFTSAAIVDGIVLGTAVVAGATLVGAVSAISAPVVVVGGAVIVTAVGWGVVKDAGWEWFKQSGMRDSAIETTHGVIDNFGSHSIQVAADRVQNAFNDAIHSISNIFGPHPVTT